MDKKERRRKKWREEEITDILECKDMQEIIQFQCGKMPKEKGNHMKDVCDRTIGLSLVGKIQYAQ